MARTSNEHPLNTIDKLAIASALLCSTLWYVTDWSSTVPAREFIESMTWACLGICFGVNALIKHANDEVTAIAMANLVKQLRVPAIGLSAALLVLTVEFSASLMLPSRAVDTEITRVPCSSSGAGRLSGMKSSTDVDGGRPCFSWSMGDGPSHVERLDNVDPSAISMHGKLMARIEVRDSFLFGTAAWYRVLK